MLAAFDEPVDRAPSGHAFYEEHASWLPPLADQPAVTLRNDDVTGVVLAGGMGRRMGGVDKGLVLLDGEPMVAHVLERLAPQVGALVINANQNLERYAAFGHPGRSRQQSAASRVRSPDCTRA